MGAMPTDGMKEEARRYRAWKEEGRKGGTDIAFRGGLLGRGIKVNLVCHQNIPPIS